MPVALSNTANNLVRSQFIAKDFDTYVSEIKGFLFARFGDVLYNNFVASDMGQVLLEAESYALSSLSWFLDRQAGEVYLETAELSSSAARLARLVGYKARGASASTGNVQLTILVPEPFIVTVQKGTQLVTPGGVIYETSLDVVIPANTITPTTIPVVEGRTVEEIFTSNGAATQSIPLRRIPTGSYASQGSAVVKVDGVEWTQVDFIDFFQTNQVEIAYAEDPPTVRFGDGIAGNIPPNGAEIRVQYRVTLGAAGAVVAGTLTSFTQPVVANFTTIPTKVTNNDATAPGSDPDSIAKTKALAPAVFRTAERAVTEGDYTTLVQAFSDPNFGNVAVGRAVIVRSLDEDAETRSILAMLVSALGPPLTNGSGGACTLQFTMASTTVTAVAGGNFVNEVTVGTALKAPNGSIVLVASVQSNTQLTLGTAYGGATATIVGFDPTLLQRLQLHWTEVLSSSCEANLVSVQILQRDTDGRLIAPNVGLASALKTYLKTVKEATVTVSVTDGSVNLFNVNTDVQVKILAGYNRVTVTGAVQAAVDSYLNGKQFGESVYVSDVYALIEAISGVDHANVLFSRVENAETGQAVPKTDSFGNVIVQSFEVVTLGVTSVTTIES